ncbi:DUF1513 domain-containing protein [Lentibacter sp. XHP0401]|uniref:DUF1513 domain-containing protein n=1 Tax=Lentibacter sp. XHP0401 TaxID=2984334 RepID=UPI0021E87200|nr:DUF1513 domain-containing protein [Lentibacter sp. XHP0401]MCV2894242.1 DUF1513 domain-containing protein [Lentibacter sp. XHP0401]
MTSRRNFIAGLLASGMSPQLTWADVGAPSYLSAARNPDGSYALFGVKASGSILFKVPLPARGHAAATHPRRPEAVAFARRPGVFAVVLDCTTGLQVAELNAAPDRHFYGHGAFSADGAVLYTTENDLETGEGIIGVWNAAEGYVRMGEFASGGVGPHDVKLMPDGASLVVANGGIETHPDSGRAKLNIPTMQPRLSYVNLSGDVLEQVALPSEMHKNSIRHLSVSADGLVAFAMQWQGSLTSAPALLGLHRRGQAPRLLQANIDEHRILMGYAGSIALSVDTSEVAITSPKGGVVQVFNTQTGQLRSMVQLKDVCGISAGQQGFHVTTGTGLWGNVSHGGLSESVTQQVQWDNHLMPVAV